MLLCLAPPWLSEMHSTDNFLNIPEVENIKLELIPTNFSSLGKCSIKLITSLFGKIACSIKLLRK